MQVRKSPPPRKLILLVVSGLLVTGLASLSVVYAQTISTIVVSAVVPPTYSVSAKGDNLYVQTNMKLFVNGKRVAY